MTRFADATKFFRAVTSVADGKQSQKDLTRVTVLNWKMNFGSGRYKTTYIGKKWQVQAEGTTCRSQTKLMISWNYAKQFKKLNWVLRILWKEQSSDPHPQRYIVELKKGHERQKDNQSSSTKDELNQDLLTWKRRQLRRDMMEGYRIISNTENMAHFIFSGMKLGGKINKQAVFPHNMQKNHETPCCYDV